jgi:hypothetical protein
MEIYLKINDDGEEKDHSEKNIKIIDKINLYFTKNKE